MTLRLSLFASSSLSFSLLAVVVFVAMVLESSSSGTEETLSMQSTLNEEEFALGAVGVIVFVDMLFGGKATLRDSLGGGAGG